MSAPRFYTPGATFELGTKTLLSERARHHAGRVLRMVAGDEAVLFDGQGHCARGPIAFGGPDAWITVQAIEEPAVESPLAITLIQSFVAPEKADWILDKAIELGVKRVIFTPAERSVTRLSGDRLTKRLAHWQDVAVSACEQSGRCVLPAVETAPNLPAALAGVQAQSRIILAPGATEPVRLTNLTSCAFAVGPEGGFSAAEIQAAVDAGWQCCLLGPRVLRTETAGLAAIAAANALSGDFTAR